MFVKVRTENGALTSPMKYGCLQFPHSKKVRKNKPSDANNYPSKIFPHEMVRTPDKLKGLTESHSILCGIKLRYSIYSFIVQITIQLDIAFLESQSIQCLGLSINQP